MNETKKYETIKEISAVEFSKLVSESSEGNGGTYAKISSEWVEYGTRTRSEFAGREEVRGPRGGLKGYKAVYKEVEYPAGYWATKFEWVDGHALFVIGHGDKDRLILEAHKCVHEFNGNSVGRCWSKHTCAKCGYTYDIDSSD